MSTTYEQACSDCGTWEAAGPYCTRCLRHMGPADWYPNGDEKRRHAVQAQARGKALVNPYARVKRPRRRKAAAEGTPV